MKRNATKYGGIAQLARALGSYPGCRWFESDCRYHIWPVGQAVKTSPFHGGIMGSIPVRVTTPRYSRMALQSRLGVFHSVRILVLVFIWSLF